MESSTITATAKMVLNQTGGADSNQADVASEQVDEVAFKVKSPCYLYSKDYSYVLFYIMVDQPEVIVPKNCEIEVAISRSGSPTGQVELATVGFQLNENGFILRGCTNVPSSNHTVSQVFHLRRADSNIDDQKTLILKEGQGVISLTTSPSSNDLFLKTQTEMKEKQLSYDNRKRFDLC